MKGVVTKSTGSWYWVRTQDHQVHQCRIRGKFRTRGIKSTSPEPQSRSPPSKRWSGTRPASSTCPDKESLS